MSLRRDFIKIPLAAAALTGLALLATPSFAQKDGQKALVVEMRVEKIKFPAAFFLVQVYPRADPVATRGVPSQ